MKNHKQDLKFRDSDYINQLITIFEMNSYMVKNMKHIKLLLAKIVLSIVIYFLTIILFHEKDFIQFIASIIFLTLLLLYIFQYYYKGLYNNSKNLGGKKPNFIKIKEIEEYNYKLMRKDEEYLVKKILIINNLYSFKCIEEIRDAIKNEKVDNEFAISNMVKNIFSAYLVPILFGVIGIYFSLSESIEFYNGIVNILNISFVIIIIFTILIILGIIFKVRSFSITDNYTKDRLNALLTNIIINMKKNKIKNRKKKM